MSGDEPYYFEIIPRTIISKSGEKEQGEFRLHVYKTTQQVDFTKEALSADFNERKMTVKNVKLNFFLPNYIAGKNTNAKFIFQLSKKPKHLEEREVGQYTIDPNIYIEEFKRSEKNHYAELWELSDSYSVEVELFFEESRYMLEKVLREYRNNPASQFIKPLVSKALEKAKKVEIEEDEEYDNEERYKEKRLELLNKYSGAIVGQGGYRIFNEEEEKIMSKKQSQQSVNSSEKGKKFEDPLEKSSSKILKGSQPNKSNESSPEKPAIKRTDSLTVGKPLNEEFSEHEIKNMKYLIIVIMILILTGSGYFVSKIFLKEEAPSTNFGNDDIDDLSQTGKKSQSEKHKKVKSGKKNVKKSKKTEEL